MELDNETIKEYNVLITRAQTYQKTEIDDKPNTKEAKKQLNRNKTYILCETHEKEFNHKWNNESKNCVKCICFQHENHLPKEKLPTNKQVLSHLFYVVEKQKGQHKNPYAEVASDLMLQWIYCNIYTISEKHVKKQVRKLHDRFFKLNKVKVIKRKTTFYANLQ